LAAKLAPIKLTPGDWIEWSAFLGGSGDAVQAHYPHARHWVIEPSPVLRERSQQSQSQRASRSWRGLWRKPAVHVWTPEEAASGPWQPQGARMLWANMTLHSHADLPRLMAAWFRQLAVDGFLMCSGLGPDTARELREIYRDIGWPLPTIDFIDMHDIGDELVRAGFADPVMDMERLTLTWATPEAMLDEMRTWGGNVATGRFIGLRTPRWRERLQALLRERLIRPDGRLGLTVELIYGHAIKPVPRAMMAPETRVSLDDMRHMASKRSRP
jgi:malonyl-CoA O-methyltransferase